MVLDISIAIEDADYAKANEDCGVVAENLLEKIFLVGKAVVELILVEKSILVGIILHYTPVKCCKNIFFVIKNRFLNCLKCV